MTHHLETGLRKLTLADLRDLLQRDVQAYPHLANLRAFNHLMVGELGKCSPLPGCALLDLGASIHGYAWKPRWTRGWRATRESTAISAVNGVRRRSRSRRRMDASDACGR